MIKSTIDKIRTDFSNQIIFLFVSGNTQAGIRVIRAEFDIENKLMDYSTILPGNVREIEVKAEFSTDPPDYHLNGEIEIEIINPKVKFHD